MTNGSQSQLDERLPDELRDTYDQAGNPLSLEQWHQIDRFLNPPPGPPATPAVDEEARQYVLDGLHDATWWPTHDIDDFADRMLAVALDPAEESFAEAFRFYQTNQGQLEQEQAPTFDDSDETPEPTIGEEVPEAERG